MIKYKTAWLGILLLFLIVFVAYLGSRSSKRSRSSAGGAGNGGSKYDALAAIKQSHAVVKGVNPVAGYVSAYQTSIEFYGKVVDQHGDPVAGASITIFPFDNAFGRSDTNMMLVSDASGGFSVKGLKGLAMGVETRKEGYLTYSDFGLEKPASAHRIEYGLDGTNGARFKDPNHPTIFTLYKLGPLVPLVYIKAQNRGLPVDGSPRKIALDSKKGIGTHQIEFRFTSDWNKLPNNNESNLKCFSWKLEAIIPGGGFCKRADDYAFEAPESGYQDKIVFDYPISMPPDQWKRFDHGSYFVKFQDGTYGRIQMRINGREDIIPLNLSSWLSLKPNARNLASDKKDATVWFDN